MMVARLNWGIQRLKKGVFEKLFSIMQKTQSSDEYLIQLIPRKQMSMTRKIKDTPKNTSISHHANGASLQSLLGL